MANSLNPNIHTYKIFESGNRILFRHPHTHNEQWEQGNCKLDWNWTQTKEQGPRKSVRAQSHIYIWVKFADQMQTNRYRNQSDMHNGSEVTTVGQTKTSPAPKMSQLFDARITQSIGPESNNPWGRRGGGVLEFDKRFMRLCGTCVDSLGK